jgi:hypothetical protein
MWRFEVEKGDTIDMRDRFDSRVGSNMADDANFFFLLVLTRPQLNWFR